MIPRQFAFQYFDLAMAATPVAINKADMDVTNSYLTDNQTGQRSFNIEIPFRLTKKVNSNLLMLFGEHTVG